MQRRRRSRPRRRASVVVAEPGVEHDGAGRELVPGVELTKVVELGDLVTGVRVDDGDEAVEAPVRLVPAVVGELCVLGPVPLGRPGERAVAAPDAGSMTVAVSASPSAIEARGRQTAPT